MAMLARRWNCSTADVARTIGKRLENAGLADPNSTKLHDPSEIREHVDTYGEPTTWYVLGVTHDDRIFVLDKHDRPILEL